MAETLTLNTIFISRQKRMLGAVVWDFKAIHMEMEKQMFGKQMFAGPCRDSGAQRRILTSDLTLWGASLCAPSSYYSYPWWQLPSWNRCSTFFQAVRGRSKFLPESFGPWLLKQSICIWNNPYAKETFWGGNFAVIWKNSCRALSRLLGL